MVCWLIKVGLKICGSLKFGLPRHRNIYTLTKSKTGLDKPYHFTINANAFDSAIFMACSAFDQVINEIISKINTGQDKAISFSGEGKYFKLISYIDKNKRYNNDIIMDLNNLRIKRNRVIHSFSSIYNLRQEVKSTWVNDFVGTLKKIKTQIN